MADSVKSRSSFVTRMRLMGLWGANLFAVVWFALFVVTLVVAGGDSDYATDRVSALAGASLPVAVLLILWIRRRLADWGFCPDCRALSRRRMIWADPPRKAYEATRDEAEGQAPVEITTAVEDMREGPWSSGHRSLFGMTCDLCGAEWLQVRTLVGDIPKTVVNKPVRRVPTGSTEQLESILTNVYARLRSEQDEKRLSTRTRVAPLP